jgi:hypothetical protein
MAQLRTLRQPRIYTAETALNTIGAMALKIAEKQVDIENEKESDSIALALQRLNALEQRRNRYEVAFLEKQAEISSYVGTAQNLDDLYRTGKKGGVSEITADLHKEPFKNLIQQKEAVQEQIDRLTPAMFESIQKLSKLSEAKAFFTEGIGATYKTGTGTLAEKWDPGDISEAAYRERYYPQANIPEYLREYVKKQKPAPGLLEGFQKQLEAQAWEKEKRVYEKQRLDFADEKRKMDRKQFAMAEELHAYQTGKKDLPKTESKKVEEALINENQKRADWYGTQIGLAGPRMMFATQAWTEQFSSDDDKRKRAGIQVNAEQLRFGLLFNPASAPELNITREELHRLDGAGMMEKYLNLIEDDKKVMKTMEMIDFGDMIFKQNMSTMMPPKSTEIGRGVSVRYYNERDELIAMAYKKYKDYQKAGGVGGEIAENYREDIMSILGINLQMEHQVRESLEEFFKKNYIEQAIGIEGGFETDIISSDKYTKEQKDAAAIWDETVLKNYGYDMGQDEWFPE